MTEITSRGATLVTLSPQIREFSMAWAKEDKIAFDVLTDLGHGVARSYGLAFRLPDDLQRVYLDHLKIDLPRFNGDASWELPLPATYVVGPDGGIAYAAASADYTRRPEPAELLPVLDGLV